MINLESLENEIKARGLSSFTLKFYLRYNKDFLKFVNKAPEAIVQEDVKNYLNFLAEKKLKPNSISLATCALKFYYGEVLRKDLFKDIKSVKSEKNIVEGLTKEEVNKLISSVENLKHKLLLGFMYTTGLRVSEVVKLKVKDLRLKNKIGKINEEKRQRQFVLSENLLKYLNEYLGFKGEQSEFLFPSKDRHISVRMAQKIITKAAKKANMGKRVYCNLLRTSYAKHLLENGVDKTIVNALLGYKNFSKKLSSEIIINIKSPLD